jgi:hypothetical protein
VAAGRVAYGGEAERLVLVIAPDRTAATLGVLVACDGDGRTWAVDFGPDGLLPPAIDRLMGLVGFRAFAEGRGPSEIQNAIAKRKCVGTDLGAGTSSGSFQASPAGALLPNAGTKRNAAR